MPKIFRCSLYALTCAVALAGAARAQNQSDHPPSPQRRAAFQAMHQACAHDLQSLCPSQERREAMTCLKQNLEHASDACKAAVASLPPRRE